MSWQDVPMGSRREVLVVGAGVGGAVVAQRLARAGWEVDIICEGPLGEVPAAMNLHTASTPDRAVTSLVRRVTGGPLVPYMRGRGWGGGAAINAMVWDEPSATLESTHQVRTDEVSPFARAVAESDPSARQVRLAGTGSQRATPVDGLRDMVRVIEGTVAALRVERGRVVALVCSDGTERAASTVVLAAGALGTPEIMLRSGVCQLGRHLVDHPSVMIPVTLRTPSAIDLARPVVTTEIDRRDGRMLVVDSLGPDRPGEAALVVALTTPASAGTVTVSNDDPSAEMLVEFDLLRGDDAHRLAGLVADATDILGQQGVAGVVADVAVPHSSIVDWVREQVATQQPVYSHAACAVAGVVTRHGRVRGIDGVYVADVSALQRAPHGNPMSSIAAHAAAVADYMMSRGER